ncbi:GntR family transcriptional regulator [Fuscibacter oryzae]|uniref:GntR family transcriptional regulator n=1 Tax=Fuscibacter oryzae TaxID=2803939 RepID=A0A8J7MSZ6_9RHOB|nr:GntR family transcriptional regulator [Fuscibacter oryzae]MBL4929533.1 GntR family transcriptional regulator [Fuscibacter oryzae]
MKRQTASEQVANHIGAMILSGELVGGEQLRQEALADRLGVSRIPIREALLILEASGLVVSRPHRGAVVAELTVEDAHDLFASRLIVEPALVERACELHDASEAATAVAAMKAYEDGIRDHAPEAELSRLNWELHLCLMKPSRMTRMLGFVETLLASADRYLRIQIRPAEAQEHALEDHRNLVEAFCLRLPERARDITAKHIMRAREETIIGLGKLKGPLAPRK